MEREETINIIKTIKREINDLDPFCYIGSGSGCAAEIKNDILNIINTYIYILEGGSDEG